MLEQTLRAQSFLARRLLACLADVTVPVDRETLEKISAVDVAPHLNQLVEAELLRCVDYDGRTCFLLPDPLRSQLRGESRHEVKRAALKRAAHELFDRFVQAQDQPSEHVENEVIRLCLQSGEIALLYETSARRAEHLLQKQRHSEALAICDQTLAFDGATALSKSRLLLLRASACVSLGQGIWFDEIRDALALLRSAPASQATVRQQLELLYTATSWLGHEQPAERLAKRWLDISDTSDRLHQAPKSRPRSPTLHTPVQQVRANLEVLTGQNADPNVLSRLCSAVCDIAWELQEHVPWEDVLTMLEPVVPWAERCADRACKGDVFHLLGTAYYMKDRFQEAEAPFRKALEYRLTENRSIWAYTAVALARTLRLLGSKQESTQLLQQAIETYRKAHDLDKLPWHLFELGPLVGRENELNAQALWLLFGLNNAALDADMTKIAESYLRGVGFQSDNALLLAMTVLSTVMEHSKAPTQSHRANEETAENLVHRVLSAMGTTFEKTREELLQKGWMRGTVTRQEAMGVLEHRGGDNWLIDKTIFNSSDEK